MRNILIILLSCMLTVVAYAQGPQKVNTFKVVDAKTLGSIPYTSINIVRAKLTTTTEDNGVFHIPGDLATMRDTIIFYAQTYIPLKLPLSKLATIDTVMLTKAIGPPKTTTGKYSAKAVLNDRATTDVDLYAGVGAEGAPFNYMQIAQRFDNARPNSRLATLNINKSRNMEPTKYRIRIYDVDPKTGGPGADICDQIIDQDNIDDVTAYGRTDKDRRAVYLRSSAVDIDVTRFNIVIPGNSFFVAVEWLRGIFNVGKAPIFNKASGKVDTLQVYRPLIGVSPIQGPKLNIWVMGTDRNWKLYDHFIPFGTDLAIKATVEVP